MIIVWGYIGNVMNGQGGMGMKILIGDFLYAFGYREMHILFPTFKKKKKKNGMEDDYVLSLIPSVASSCRIGQEI